MYKSSREVVCMCERCERKYIGVEASVDLCKDCKKAIRTDRQV